MADPVTRRDLFAAFALVALTREWVHDEAHGGQPDRHRRGMAKRAWQIADAMLAEEAPDAR